MQDRLITVVGGGGFVGRYTVQALLARGARVRIAQRDPRQAWYLKAQGGLGQVQFAACDIAKADTVARAVAGSDAVVNLVGILSGDFDAVHGDGAATLAKAAAAAGAGAFVQVSAIGADPDSPSAYGRSKAAGEAAVRAAFPAATILRPSIIFGREDGFVNRFARMIAATPVVPVVAPNTVFQPVHVGDVAHAIVAALADPKAFGGRIFELGGPDRISMAGLIRWIADQTGHAPAILELPDAVGAGLAMFGFLPGAPITRDQWAMLQRDNVVGDGTQGIDAFGIAPVTMGSVAPGWLVQYRRHGRFGRRVAA